MSETTVTILVILFPTFALGCWLAYRGIRRARAAQLHPGFGGHPAGNTGSAGAAHNDMSLALASIDDAAPRKSSAAASRDVDFDTPDTKTYPSSGFGSGSSSSGGSDGGGGGGE